MLQPLRRYADFQGRASRSEFWLFQLLKWGSLIVLFLVTGALGSSGRADQNAAAAGVFGLFLIVWILGLLIPNLAVSVRRLHDVNQSGWLLLLGIVPFLGFIALFILSLVPGTVGRNDYGRDPSEPPMAPAAEIFS